MQKTTIFGNPFNYLNQAKTCVYRAANGTFTPFTDK